MSGAAHRRATPIRDAPGNRRVSRPHDASEREADRAAEIVGRGGSVAGWSFASVPASEGGAVHRQETGGQGGKEPTEDEKYKAAALKAAEAALETKQGKALKAAVLADPLVKSVKDAATSPAGIATLITTGVAGVGVLAATGRELPFQPPAIPLDFITPGLSAKVTWRGPVNAPTEGGIVLTFREQGPKGSATVDADRQRAQRAREVADLRAFQEGLRYAPGSKEAEEQRMTQEAIARVVARSSSLPGLFIPFDPAKKPEPAPPESAGPEPKAAATGSTQETQKKKPDDAPVQREPASTADHLDGAEVPAAHVDDALSSSGRPLDSSTRHFMESRFGVDFSSVRIHDDSRAAEGARGLDAAAFTVGSDVVFGPGRFDPQSRTGRHLLAHELSHVVQQSRARPGALPLQRRGAGEWLGVFFGTEEGNWTERELTEYLALVTKARAIEGSFDSDNKARAIVARWKAADAAFDLSPAQKVLLIEEMLDGPTLIDDETAIIDLLELSEAIDLPRIVGPAGVGLGRIESDVDDAAQRSRLDTWVATRFEGGRDAVLAGKVKVQGPAVPAKAPAFGFSAAGLDWRIDSARTDDELIDLITAYPGPQRDAALHHLVAVRRPALQRRQEEIIAEGRAENSKDAPDKAKLDAITARYKAHQEYQLRTERLILHFLGDAVPAAKEDLRTGTTPTDPARKAEIDEALKPPVRRTAAGAPEKFRPTVPGEVTNYAQKLTALLVKIVDRSHAHLVGGKGPAEHADPKKMHTLTEFERIGKRAKAETDHVFGAFKKGDELVADKPARRGNIRDQFRETERDLARMTPAQRTAFARKLCLYFFTTEGSVGALNFAHNASPDFDDTGVPTNDEAKAQVAVADAFVADAANVVRCNEIDRNWPATAQPKKKLVFFQLFREPDAEKDRLLLWDTFQTFIHEYLHTLAHERYRTYAGSFGDDSAQENTLMEGVDSLLTEVVWDAVEPKVADDDLRQAVEGPEASKPPLKSIPHPGITQRYRSYAEALALVDKVGIQNLFAAYFLGLVDRIGGTP